MAGESISEAEFHGWEPWAAAYRRVREGIGHDQAKVEIGRRLAFGLLKVAARDTFVDGVAEAPFSIVKQRLWELGGSPGDYANVWETSSFDFNFGSGPDRAIYQFQGLRFERSGIDRILEDAGVSDLATGQAAVMPPPIPVAPVPTPSVPLGRRRKEYWEDAIVEMFDRIFHGSFNPRTQAEVESAMAEWISAKHDDRPSEASVRTRAAKVFRTHKREG